MKLLILGATGGTGLELVRKAIQHGHEITALVRSPDRLKKFDGQIAIKHGDLLDDFEIRRAATGQDAVLSTFGPRMPLAKTEHNLLQRFAGALTAGLPPAGVKRLVLESNAFLFKNAILPPAHLIGQIFFGDIVEDSSKMESKIRNSILDWTIVRPSRLTNSAYTGTYRSQENHLPSFGFTVSRSNVADFMIKAVEHKTTIEKIYGISD